MATKSILKTIYIKDSQSAKNLVSALENAKTWKGKEVTISKKCFEATDEEVLKIFGGEDGGVCSSQSEEDN